MDIRAQIPRAFRELLEPHRWKVFYGGRGGAKSTAFANVLLLTGLQEPLRILCAREIQNSIKDSVHSLLKDRIRILGLEDEYEIQETQILGKNGTRFLFAGLYRNIASIQSLEGIDRVWVEEATTVSRDSWDKLIPTIRKPGSEIWVSYNPRLKSDAIHQIIHVEGRSDAVVRKVSWRDNPWASKEMLQEMEDLKKADYPKYLHVWEGEFREYAEGAVYAKQLQAAREEGRICKVPIQPACEVNVFADLGYSDATALWFHQRVGPEDRFIDYLELRGADIDEIAKAVKAKGYNFGRFYMPHDVDHEILGFGHKTRKQMFEQAGMKPITVVPRIRHIHEGIEMTRAAFASYWFDAERCERGLECIANYRYERSERRDDLQPEPLHDWASHAADALRQHAQGFRKAVSWAPESAASDRRQKAMTKWNSGKSAAWIV